MCLRYAFFKSEPHYAYNRYTLTLNEPSEVQRLSYQHIIIFATSELLTDCHYFLIGMMLFYLGKEYAQVFYRTSSKLCLKNVHSRVWLRKFVRHHGEIGPSKSIFFIIQ